MTSIKKPKDSEVWNSQYTAGAAQSELKFYIEMALLVKAHTRPDNSTFFSSENNKYLQIATYDLGIFSRSDERASHLMGLNIWPHRGYMFSSNFNRIRRKLLSVQVVTSILMRSTRKYLESCNHTYSDRVIYKYVWRSHKKKVKMM